MIGQSKEDKWHETHRILENLFLVAEMRGRDATGFVAMTDSLEGSRDGKSVIAKDAVPASKFVETNSPWRALKHRRCSMVLGHVRLATHGSPKDVRNNHPHSADKLHLVHNGILPGHLDLVDRYCLKVESTCDSEVLLRVVERSKTVSIGLSLCLLERPGAIVVFDEQRQVCWMGRDESRPLWVGRLKNDGRLFFASTSGILIEGIQNALQTNVTFDFLMPLAPDYIYCASTAGTIGAVYEDPLCRKSPRSQ